MLDGSPHPRIPAPRNSRLASLLSASVRHASGKSGPGVPGVPGRDHHMIGGTSNFLLFPSLTARNTRQRTLSHTVLATFHPQPFYRRASSEPTTSHPSRPYRRQNTAYGTPLDEYHSNVGPRERGYPPRFHCRPSSTLVPGMPASFGRVMQHEERFQVGGYPGDRGGDLSWVVVSRRKAYV